MPRPLSIEQRLEMFPPIACRLLARVRVAGRTQAMTTAEIAAGAIMTVPRVHVISGYLRWDAVPCGEMLRFTRACNVIIDDRDSVKRHRAYIRKVKGLPRYLMRSPEWRTILKPLATRWTQS